MTISSWNPAGVAVLTHPMAASSLQDDPKRWRQLAQDARVAADRLGDPDAKRTMLEIAEGYEQLASLAEKKMASKSNR
jgi:hypothetical protein